MDGNKISQLSSSPSSYESDSQEEPVIHRQYEVGDVFGFLKQRRAKRHEFHEQTQIYSDLETDDFGVPIEDIVRKWWWDKSILIFSPTNPIRVATRGIVNNRWFDRSIFLVILANCITLALWDPTGASNQDYLTISDYVFTAIFTVEMIIRIISRGFIFNSVTESVRKTYGLAYLRDPWNWLDFIVVVTAYPSYFVDGPSLNVFRTFKVLRPLRTATVVPAVRRMISGLILAIPPLIDVLLQGFFVITLFSLLGLMVFMGVLTYRCVSDQIPDLVLMEEVCGYLKCPTDFTCTPNFQNPFYGFLSYDNILWALLTNFQCITLEWINPAYLIMDATTTWSYLFFLALIFVGAFVVANLITAVIAESFLEISGTAKPSMLDEDRINDQNENSIATANTEINTQNNKKQQEKQMLKDFHKRILTSYKNLTAHFDCFDPQRKVVAKFTRTRFFNHLITFVVIANTAIMASEYYGMSQEVRDAFFWCNVAFNAIFTVEMLLKMFGLGFIGYFSTLSNCFDFIIVVLSLIEYCIPDGVSGLNIFRSFRLFRLFKLLGTIPALYHELPKIIKSTWVILNFTPVLLLSLFVWSIFGMQLFGGTYKDVNNNPCPHQPDLDLECPRGNFNSFWNAFLLVFQVMTGNAWNELMFDAMHFTSPAAALFFVLMLIFLQFIILNVFLSVILVGYDEEDSQLKEEEQHTQAEAKFFKESFTADLKFIRQILKNVLTFRHPLANTKDYFEGRKKRKQCYEELAEEERQLKIKQDFSFKGVDTDDDTDENKNGKKQNHNHDQDRLATEGVKETQKKNYTVDEIFVSLDEQISDPDQKQRDNLGVNLGLYQELLDQKESELKTDLFQESKYQNQQEQEEQNEETRSCDRDKYAELNGKSLFVFSTTNWIRRRCYDIISHKYFDWFILFIILVSSVMLALYYPTMDPYSDLAVTLEISNYIFVGIFTLEAVLKIIVLGFIFHKRSYMRNPWNVLDFVIVVTGVVDIALAGTDLSILRVFRVFRALRPLRLITKLKTLNILVTSLIQAIIPCIGVFLFTFLIWTIFAILGVQLWSGTFYTCKCPELDVLSSNTTQRLVALPNILDSQDSYNSTRCDVSQLPLHQNVVQQCIDMGGQWVTFPSNFDNTAIALLTLFEVASLSNWQVIMYAAIDATKQDQLPIPYNSPAAGLYFVVFIIVGSFFVQNLVVTILVDTFSTLRKETESGITGTITEEQREWIESRKFIHAFNIIKVLHPPKGTTYFAQFRKKCFRTAVSSAFEFTIILIIILNAVTMAMEFYNQSSTWETFQFVMNYVFLVIYIVEAAIKILGLGQQYFQDGWNIFDFAIVILSIIGTGFETEIYVTDRSSIPFSPSVFQAIRGVRVIRLLRLVHRFKALRLLFDTFVFSLPSIVNIGSLIFLLCYVYAIIGVSLFGDLPVPLPNPPENGGAIGRYNNFSNFGWAMILLIQMITGWWWNGVMADIMSLGGAYQASFIYFVSFVLLGTFTVLNLFIAVVLDMFTLLTQREKFKVTEQDFEKFQKVWAHCDPDGRRYINIAQHLRLFLLKLGPPLGLEADTPTDKIADIVGSLKLPKNTGTKHEGFVQSNVLLQALVRRLYEQQGVDLTPFDTAKTHEDSMGIPSVKSLNPSSLKAVRSNTALGDKESTLLQNLTDEERLRVIMAATTLQNAVKKLLVRTAEAENSTSNSDIKKN